MGEDQLWEDTWDERLGWAFGLVADSAEERARAHRRLAETRGRWGEALRSYNEVWNKPDHPEYRSRADAFSRAHRFTYPHAMWHRLTIPMSQWKGLPYAILYLEWETRYPDEWRRFNDSWGTKISTLRNLEHAAAALPAGIRHQLGEVAVRAARRDYHCEDRRYARLARRLDSPALRQALEALTRDPAPTPRRHARYLLWLLDHPELPQPKTKQWHQWLAASESLAVDVAPRR